MDFKELQMYKPHKNPIRRQYQDGIWLQYRNSSQQTGFHVKINRIQVKSDQDLYRQNQAKIYKVKSGQDLYRQNQTKIYRVKSDQYLYRQNQTKIYKVKSDQDVYR